MNCKKNYLFFIFIFILSIYYYFLPTFFFNQVVEIINYDWVLFRGSFANVNDNNLNIFLSSFYIGISEAELRYFVWDNSKLFSSYRISFIYFFSFLILIIILIKTPAIFNSKKKNEEYIHAITFICLIAYFFLLIDIFNISFFHVNNFFSSSYERSLDRHYIYYNFLDKRITHINILLICSFYLLLKKKNIGLIFLVSLFFYNIITLSRIELFIIFLYFLAIYSDKINFKYSVFLMLILTFIVFYRDFLTRGGDFLLSFYWETNSLFISSVKAINQLIYKDYMDVFKDNIKFLLNDFFYFNNDLINYYPSNLMGTYSTRGIDSIYLYHWVFLIYLLIFSFITKFLFKSDKFTYVISIYLIIMALRGNFVHNFGFCIKLIIIIWFTDLILKLVKTKIK
jgi:hypothetical protein